jgi:hypothetical protein
MQSNRMFSRREQIASWNSQKICKQSLWLDYKKKGSKLQSSCSDYLIGFLFANSPVRGFVHKSFVNFNLPIKIAIFWDNRAMLLAREHPVWL